MRTNNAVGMTSKDTLNEVIQQKSVVMENDYSFKTNTMLVKQKIGKAVMKIYQLCELLGELNINIVNNRNNVSTHLRARELNPFQPGVDFLYPLKISEKL